MADEPDFDADTWLAIADHAKEQAKQKGADLKGTRRDMLKAGGALSVGALLGGGGYAASTQNAKADPSTSDSDGNVGTPSNPVDVFAEGLAGPTGDVVDVGDSLVPDTDASYDLGSSSNTWNNAHFGSVSTESLVLGESRTQDPNSPFSGSGSASYTFSLANTYDFVRIGFQDLTNTSGSADSYRLQINEDTTTNYQYTTADGAESTGQSNFKITGGVGGGGTFKGDVQFASVGGDVTLYGPFGSGTAQGTIVTGRLATDSAPLSSLTFFSKNSGTFDIKIRVVGWNGGI